jgi:hypothetical protein
MNIEFCYECGDYYFPEVPRVGNQLMRCSICNTPSVLPENIVNRKLVSLRKQMKEEFPEQRFLDDRPQYRPLNYLIEALSQAKYFINIVTESTDRFFLGVLSLKLIEKDIPINIVLWHSKITQDLSWLWEHSRIIKGYGSKKSFKEREITTGIRVDMIRNAHQKFVFVDGIVAFEGSANATLHGWTQQGNSINFVIDPTMIQILNRRYFSRYTAKKRRAPS